MISSKIITFKGMPLFQKARFKTPYVMQGEIRDFACFFYMLEGEMHSYDTRGMHKIGEKEALIKNCNNYVQRYVTSGLSEECEAIAIYLYPKLLQEIYKEEVPSFLQHKENPKPEKLIGNKLIEQYMLNLSIYFESPESFDEELGILKLKELMIILLKSQNHESVRKLLSEIFAPVNIKFKEAVEANLLNNLSMTELAFICNMSLSTFKRVFKKTFQETPARYIKNKKLEYAASQLLCNNDPISTVAFKSGFEDVTTFSSTFNDKYKMSPSNYRLNYSRN